MSFFILPHLRTLHLKQFVMSTAENTHLFDYVIDGMRKAADELEKFQLKAGLGKMEALEAYEELKKKYAHYTNELKIKADQGKETLKDLQSKFQELQVQLNLGKAETVEAFKEQQKKIMLAIHEVKVAIENNPTVIKAYTMLLAALEQLKIKLEILEKELQPMKEKLSAQYETRKAQVEDAINNFKNKFKDTDFDQKMGTFQKEMGLAYEHFKKAFVQ